MLNIEQKPVFLKKISKIKDNLFKERVKKQIAKIIENPEIGKPMRYSRKGSREVYISPFRLTYKYYPQENKVLFADFYYKDKQ